MVCLTATADGGKKKAFFVFKGGKLQVNKVNKACKTKCFVKASFTGWMDEDLAQWYCYEVLGTFTSGAQQLLAWNSFQYHLTPEAREIL